MTEVTCPSCGIPVEPRPPRSTWKIAVAVFWICSLLTATAFSLLLGLNVVLVPVWFAIGASVGAAAIRAGAWTCPSCHGEVAAPSTAHDEEEIGVPGETGVSGAGAPASATLQHA